MNLQPIVELIEQESCFNLVAHVLPDGDSIGSLLALGEALQSMGKTVALYSPGRLPKKYAFLKGSERIAGTGMDARRIPVVLALDCSDLERLDLFKEEVLQARHLVNIDHHVTNKRYGTLNLVDPQAAATGEIVLHILKALPVPLTHSIAEALYVAISTDTGSFKYDNTTAAAHRAAAALLELPIKPGVLAQRIFDERPLHFFLLLKEALSTLELYEGGRLAVMTVNREMLDCHGTSVEEIEGLVNYTRNIEGVEIGVLFYVENASEVKVGFRSRVVDISKLAGRLNGGGHPKAAGCRMHGSYGSVKEKVLREAAALLEQQAAGERSSRGGRNSKHQ
ncbi:MAG: bifunctional oligoribonuclease/PAP phosphatase NrnA [Bacillota bacterium]